MRFVIGFLVLLSTLSLSGKDVLKNVEEKYKTVRTISCDFNQVITYASTGQKAGFSGRLSAEKPDKMRMSVFKPDTQLMISDGKGLWVYVQNANQAIFYDLTKQEYPQIGKLLFEVSEQFQGELRKKTQDRFVLKLLPVTRSEYYDSLYARVSGKSYLMTGLTVFDKEGNKVEYGFSAIKVNAALGEDHFTFVPPAGTTVIKR
jgi:outer membrane lipoprotein carrier protein